MENLLNESRILHDKFRSHDTPIVILSPEIRRNFGYKKKQHIFRFYISRYFRCEKQIFSNNVLFWSDNVTVVPRGTHVWSLNANDF